MTSDRQPEADAAVGREEQYRSIFENAPVGIYQTAPDGRILAANQALAVILGVGSPADLIGSSITAFYARPDDRAALIAKHEPLGAVANMEIEWRRADGGAIWVQMAALAIRNASGATEYFEGFIYDISERKRLEAQLMQAQKMDSVGRLAGGIAHDFNNLLTVMIGYAEVAAAADDLPATLQPAIKEILQAGRRAAELTSRMLTFARKQRVQPRPINVNDVVRAVEALLGRIIGEDIRLAVDLATGLPAVLVDPAQLEQVLMNLAVNARDAMPDGGTLTIATSPVVIADDEARRHPGMRPGAHVRLTVVDTGVGMDADTLSRVFEPFFTTKEPGKGTGLGMAMCYGIVKQAGGYIGCMSAPGEGTACQILLPVAAPAAAALAPEAGAANDSLAEPARRAVILVVEDEPAVRRFVADLLRSMKHEVIVAESPAEGLELAREHASRLDLVVTDVVMPHMDGAELARRVRSLQPNVRVLLMSGYQERTLKLPAGEKPPLLLPKPFTAAQLRTSVTEALDRDS